VVGRWMSVASSTKDKENVFYTVSQTALFDEDYAGSLTFMTRQTAQKISTTVKTKGGISKDTSQHAQMWLRSRELETSARTSKLSHVRTCTVR
jgi:hypothetical protein